MLGHHNTVKDMWIVYELGGKTLAKSLSEMKGTFFNSERVY